MNGLAFVPHTVPCMRHRCEHQDTTLRDGKSHWDTSCCRRICSSRGKCRLRLDTGPVLPILAAFLSLLLLIVPLSVVDPNVCPTSGWLARMARMIVTGSHVAAAAPVGRGYTQLMRSSAGRTMSSGICTCNLPISYANALHSVYPGFPSFLVACSIWLAIVPFVPSCHHLMT